MSGRESLSSKTLTKKASELKIACLKSTIEKVQILINDKPLRHVKKISTH